jgi:hypothetical protein
LNIEKKTMSSFSTSSRQPDVVDVHDVRDLAPRRWPKSIGFWTLLAAALIAVATALWWTYAIYLKPIQDQRRVDEAATLLETTLSTAEWTRKTNDWPKERRLIALAIVFRDKELGVPVELGLKASRAALDLAMHNGSHEARLELGKALRDGDLGEKDPKAAASQFQAALEDLQPGIKSGDQDALYVYSLMLRDGLGIDADPKKSREIVNRVALSRDYVTMQKIGMSALYGKKDDRDFELAKAISRRLIEAGQIDQYWLGSSACFNEFKRPDGELSLLRGLIEAKDFSGLRELDLRTSVRQNNLTQCQLQFVRPAAEKGDKDAIATLAEMAADYPPLAAPSRPIPTANMQHVGPEAQSRSGYLNGTKQIAKGGLSTFQVDNTKGGGDAVVRIYRDGKTPAARSMFVKNGESFTADAIAPGDYKLRYRYIGSTDTFEAGDMFALSETRTSDGTRFSRVAVTLYKVANGNMTVKKVDSSEF